MFQLIEEYIQKPQIERLSHVVLSEPCIEIGGRLSTEYRGLLAHHLMTTIPTAKKILLCHACGNGKCSNPRHLYWGTYSENLRDAYNHGAMKTQKEYYIEKHGEEAYRAEMGRRAAKGGKAFKPTRSLKNDRILEIQTAIENEPKTWGWIGRVSKKLDVSHTQVQRYIKKWSLSRDSNPDLDG